jgi:hypothetical protein
MNNNNPGNFWKDSICHYLPGGSGFELLKYLREYKKDEGADKSFSTLKGNVFLKL